MPRKKFRESFAARMFFLMFFLLTGAGAVTFGLIAWATPSAYLTVISQDLKTQACALTDTLNETARRDWETVLDRFLRSSQADMMLLSAEGEQILMDSRPAFAGLREGSEGAHHSLADVSVSLTETAEEDGAEWEGRVNTSWDLESQTPAHRPEGTGDVSGVSAVATLPQYAVLSEVTPSDSSTSYTLCVMPRVQKENLAVRALIQMAPWLFLALLLFSFLCAFVCSRYVARPIVRISRIAGRLAELDFSECCGGRRRDEIGALARSLDQMAGRLAAALSGLSSANEALKKEMERERNLERSRMEFFFAASHELKTPVTILKGQLSGMLEGVDVYRDRDKYLLRSLQVTGRMERLIGEMLVICRMETASSPVRQQPLDLPSLIRRQLASIFELMEQKGQSLSVNLDPVPPLAGEPNLMETAIGNLFSNAVRHSPEGAEIRVWCGMERGTPAFCVENTGVHIREDALLRLFEPFYRADGSRNRNTGGSGLGLYLTREVLKRHHAVCTIQNTDAGVRAFVSFGPPAESAPDSPFST